MSRTTKKNQTPKRVWSRTSARNLETCHSDIVRVLEAALPDAPYDFKVICGHRGKAAQDKAVSEKRSKTPWPRSKHNKFKSHAADIIPLPLNWDDHQMFVDLAQHVLAVAEEMGVAMRWGGDWDMDKDWRDERFFDGPHFELI